MTGVRISAGSEAEMGKQFPAGVLVEVGRRRARASGREGEMAVWWVGRKGVSNELGSGDGWCAYICEWFDHLSDIFPGGVSSLGELDQSHSFDSTWALGTRPCAEPKPWTNFPPSFLLFLPSYQSNSFDYNTMVRLFNPSTAPDPPLTPTEKRFLALQRNPNAWSVPGSHLP